MKKVLSLVLVIAMVLSSMSFAFAANFEDVADTDYEKAINALVALGVVTGYEDGTFRPEKVVTRAEMAKLIVEILGYGDLVAGSKSNFTDTQGHWADPWIALAAGRGLVIGTGDGKFTPDRTVSYDEAITMVVRALGYTDDSNELKNMSWPTNFKIKAAELGLTKDVALNATGADRGGVAQLLYNALTATLVTVNSDGDVIKSTTQTTDESGKVVVQYTELLSRIATLNNNFVVDPDHLVKDHKNYAGDLVDLAPYMYQSLKVYLNDDDEVVFIKDNNTYTVSGTVVAVNEGAETITVEDADGKEFTIDTDGKIVAFYNGEESDIEAEDFDALLYRENNNKQAQITAIGGTEQKIKSGDEIEYFVVTRATKGILVDDDYVTGRSRINGEEGNIVLPEDSDGDVDLDAITVVGAVDELDEISEGDVVIAYESLESPIVKLVVVRDTVEGTATRVSSDANTIYVDGEKYTTSRINNSVRYGDDVVVGDEGIFFLDDAGNIFAVDTEGEALTDYAWILGKADGEFGEDFDGSVEKYPQLKLLTQEGDKITYKVYATIEKVEGAFKIDDSAVYNDEYDTDIDDADILETDTTGGVTDIVFVSDFLDNINGNKKLVRYSLDEDGYIDEIEFVETELEVIDLDEIDDITSENVVVFDITAGDEEVVTVNALADNKSHNVVFKSGKIVVIATDQIDSADDIFGVIKSVNYVKNSKGDTVIEYVAFVDGEEVTYLSEKGDTIGSLRVRTTTAAAYQFTFDGDEVTNVVAINHGGSKVAKVGLATSVSSSRITVDGYTGNFASNVAVYIYDESDDAITIGSVSDLDENRMTAVYVVDNTKSTRVGIVVQVQP